MCLFTREIEPKIAQEDIHVYKVVLVKDGKYYGPYQEKPLMETPEGGLVYMDSNEYYYKRWKIYDLNESKYCIEGGVIHACTTKGMAEFLIIDLWRNNEDANYEIIDGVIPKGTEYWESYMSPEIAAKKIKFDKKYLNKE